MPLPLLTIAAYLAATLIGFVVFWTSITAAESIFTAGQQAAHKPAEAQIAYIHACNQVVMGMITLFFLGFTAFNRGLIGDWLLIVLGLSLAIYLFTAFERYRAFKTLAKTEVNPEIAAAGLPEVSAEIVPVTTLQKQAA